jgi:hypothetical protein
MKAICAWRNKDSHVCVNALERRRVPARRGRNPGSGGRPVAHCRAQDRRAPVASGWTSASRPATSPPSRSGGRPAACPDNRRPAKVPRMGDSLTVEQRTLTPLVLVRIQVPQPASKSLNSKNPSPALAAGLFVGAAHGKKPRDAGRGASGHSPADEGRAFAAEFSCRQVWVTARGSCPARKLPRQANSPATVRFRTFQRNGPAARRPAA